MSSLALVLLLFSLPRFGHQPTSPNQLETGSYVPCPHEANKLCYRTSPGVFNSNGSVSSKERLKRSQLAPYFLTLLAALALFLAILSYWSWRRTLSDRNWLLTNGKQIISHCSAVKELKPNRLSRLFPSPKQYSILTEWTDPTSSTLYRFQSESLNFHPGELVQRSELKVFLNPQDYSQYYVDVSTLPALALRNRAAR